MTRVEHQWEFLKDVATLIYYVNSNFDGVMLTGGDLWQDNDWHKQYSFHALKGDRYATPHMKDGFHPRRLAIDLNLFVDNEWIKGHHEVWDEIGIYWTQLSRWNRWGGNFRNRDYNHFERAV